MAAIASPRVSRLRRYPALAFLLAAAVLASLLPSSLRVPLSGPSASAELAPVPGKSDASTGDLSALGEASTGGLGAGAGAGAGTGGRGGRAPSAVTEEDSGTVPDSGPSGRGRNLRNKRCVGNPPRQTEDPLSPPCVAFFDGDNGGATAKGVTRDEIRVVFTDGGSCTIAPTEIDLNGPHKLAVLTRYFTERFQTYGRRVRLWRAAGPCGLQTRSVVRAWNDAVDPFAFDGFGHEEESDEAARLAVWTDIEGGSRALMRRRAPYMRSFQPDLQSHAEHVVEFVCRAVAGRLAGYSGEPSDRLKKRKFAITYRRGQDPGLVGRDLIVQGVRERCGESAGPVETASADSVPCCVGDWQRAMAGDLARWRTTGVTTVINMVHSFTLYLMPTVEGAAWHPEWLFANSTPVNNFDARAWGPGQMAHAFGIQFGPRMPERREESHRYQAYREACPDASCTVPLEEDYYTMLLLFRGIQAAGSRLTVENVDRGLRAIEPSPSPDPFTPAAYFAPGNWSFIKDAVVVRWDPTGVASGGQPGCWRYVEHGKRYRVEDWRSHPGDSVFDPGRPWPCRGEG